MELKPSDWFDGLPKYLGDRYGRPLAGVCYVIAAVAVLVILGTTAVTHLREALAPPANASGRAVQSKPAPAPPPASAPAPKVSPPPKACAPGANCSSGQTGGQSVGTINGGTINVGR